MNAAAPWAALVPLAEREYELILQGRWDEAVTASSDRAAAAQALGAPPAAARPHLERLSELQAQITAAIAAARTATLRKLGGMQRGRAAVTGYLTAGTRMARPRIDGLG
jgi:uncharacterized membrane protein YoaK (UPF0700 family)